MKNIYLILTALLSLFACTNKSESVTADSEKYYWYDNQKIALRINEREKFILFSDNVNPKASYYSKIKRTLLGEGMNPYKPGSTEKYIHWGRFKIDELKNIVKEDILYEAPSFYNAQNEVITVSNVFYVKISRKEDITMLDKMATENNIEIIGNNKLTPLWFMLSCTSESAGNALEMANKFYESGHFLASEPEFLTD